MAGMRQLLDALARLRQEVPLTLATPHILLTKVDARTTLAAHVQLYCPPSMPMRKCSTVMVRYPRTTGRTRVSAPSRVIARRSDAVSSGRRPTASGRPPASTRNRSWIS